MIDSSTDTALKEQIDRYFGEVPEWKSLDDPLCFEIADEIVREIHPSGNIPVVRVDSWRRFPDLLEHKFFSTGREEWVFRGQRRFDWPLSPSLGRKTDGVVPEILANAQLDRFRRAVRGRLKDNSILLNGDVDAELELWAVGQHHGLHTPLLDWTASPYVSLFFAFEEDNKRHETYNPFRAVYALNKNQLISDDKFSEIAVVEPKIDDHGRLVNQAGLFVKCPYENTIENEIINALSSDENFQIDDADKLARYICKIYIPNDEITECRQALKKMNIHHGSLFPDVIGASSYCNAEVPDDLYNYAKHDSSIEALLKKIDMSLVPVVRGVMAGDMEEVEEDYAEERPIEDKEVISDGLVPPPMPEDASSIPPVLEEEIRSNLKSSMLVDWAYRERAQASMRNKVRKFLRKSGYSSDESQRIAKDVVQKLVAESLEDDGVYGHGSVQQGDPDDDR